jgi:hypothetical protein
MARECWDFCLGFTIWNPSQIWIIKKLLIVEIGDLGDYLLQFGTLEVAMFDCAMFQFPVEM